jgi:hypothetical protein
MSEVKVNKISPRTACGTVTLGDSGDTFTIPSGATINNQGTAVNFGATGSASWVTIVKTADFTAVAGEGYFVNTTSGAKTVTLPSSPAAGSVVAVKDYANTFDTNAVTLGRNGSNINGAAADSTLSIEGLAVTLVYVDSTKGWLITDNGDQTTESPSYVTATGGTITTIADYKVHTFTGPGALCVSNAGNSLGSNTVDYLVVSGGGGAGGHVSAGGGAGGARMSSGTASGSYTASPLGACVSALPVSVQPYTVTVGAGGAGVASYSNPTNPGSVSTFSTITSTGGGGSGTYSIAAGNGGSGGGAPANAGGGNPTTQIGVGNTPPVSPPQGNSGGQGLTTPGADSAGAGGGASAVGINSTPSLGGVGGAGIQNNICGNSYYWSGGAGGSAGSHPTHAVSGGCGGIGGGGGASIQGSGSPGAGGGSAINNGAAGGGPTGGGGTGGSGGANSGGGGGGGAHPGGNGGAGGSGIVIIRYKFQN